VLCDIPGLIKGAADGAGLGPAFLRHVQRCKVLLHVVDGMSEDPLGDFHTINNELLRYDEFLAQKPQVVVLNKIDIPQVKEQEEELLAALRKAAGHTRVMSISAATRVRVKELMGRLKKFVAVQPDADLPALPEIDLSKAGLDYDSDDFGTYHSLVKEIIRFVALHRCPWMQNNRNNERPGLPWAVESIWSLH
jgi:GTP-binding protein